jgi:SMI1 / KNR4 family (SUKH-1)
MRWAEALWFDPAKNRLRNGSTRRERDLAGNRSAMRWFFQSSEEISRPNSGEKARGAHGGFRLACFRFTSRRQWHTSMKRTFQVGHGGCTRRQIGEIEARLGVQLPNSYRRFLSRFGRDTDACAALRGSDCCFSRLLDLRTWADQLLRESSAPFALHSQDFVFLMHQGYQFYFFRADGLSDDPPVFYFFEGWKQPEQKFSTITDWLKEYGVFVA